MHSVSNMSMNMNNNTTVETGWKEVKFLIKELHYLVLALLIVAVNSGVVLTVWRQKILHKWQNYLLVSLACSDLSTGLLGLPLVLLCTLSNSPDYGCILCSTAYTFTKFLSISTILHLLIVTYERFVYIVYPFDHERLSGKRFHFKLILVVLWTVGLGVALVPFQWLNLHDCSDTDHARQWLLYTVITLVLFLIIPMILFIYAFGRMFTVARVHIRKREALITSIPGSHTPDRNATRKEARVAIIFVLMWAAFVIFWSPYFVLNITEELEIQIEVPDTLWEAASVLRCLTSLLNPVLYSFLKRDFCQALGFSCVKKCGVCRGCCLPCNRMGANREEVNLHSKIAQKPFNLETAHQGLITQTSTV